MHLARASCFLCGAAHLQVCPAIIQIRYSLQAAFQPARHRMSSYRLHGRDQLQVAFAWPWEGGGGRSTAARSRLPRLALNNEVGVQQVSPSHTNLSHVFVSCMPPPVRGQGIACLEIGQVDVARKYIACI